MVSGQFRSSFAGTVRLAISDDEHQAPVDNPGSVRQHQRMCDTGRAQAGCCKSGANGLAEPGCLSTDAFWAVRHSDYALSVRATIQNIDPK